MDDDVQSLVAEQITYYRAHASDYDNDIVGPHPDWSRSIDELPIAGDVLELACGGGRWTPLLADRARFVTAVDAAPEMLALARRDQHPAAGRYRSPDQRPRQACLRLVSPSGTHTTERAAGMLRVPLVASPVDLATAGSSSPWPWSPPPCPVLLKLLWSRSVGCMDSFGPGR